MVAGKNNFSIDKHQETGKLKKLQRKEFPNQSTPPGVVPTVSLLIAPHHYFLHKVFFVVYKDCFRLVVWNNRKGILTNSLYSTIRGAKIAFSRLYRFEKAAESPDAIYWSGEFEPEERNFFSIIKEAEESYGTIN